MVHSGYLKKDGANFLIKGGAAQLFFTHRDKVIDKLRADRPKDAEYYDILPRAEDLKSRENFPTFNRNWIDGIVTFCLNAINLPPSISEVLIPDADNNGVPPVIIYDPQFVYEDPVFKSVLSTGSDPSLDINGIKQYFGFTTLGGSTNGYNTAVGDVFKFTDPNVKTVYPSAIPGILSTYQPKYEKPNPENFIPENPSDDFSDLNYEGSDGLNLPDKQKQLTTSIVDSLNELITILRTTAPATLEPLGSPDSITTENNGALNAIYELAKSIIKKNFPKPVSDCITNEVNYLTLQEMLVKPIVLAAIGTIFGSSEKGFTGLMQAISPDPVGLLNPQFPDPVPLKLNLVEETEEVTPSPTGDDSLIYTIPSKDQGGYNPNGTLGVHKLSIPARKKLVEICKKLTNLNGGIKFEPDWLVGVMSIETGYTFSHSIQNETSKATGYIQFMPATAKKLDTTIEQLIEMGPVLQFDYVYKYFEEIFLKNKNLQGNIKKAGEAYLMVFSPNFLIDPNLVYKEGDPRYNQNPKLDVNGDKKITKADVTSKMDNLIHKSRTSDGMGGRPKRIKVDSDEIFEVESSYYAGKL